MLGKPSFWVIVSQKTKYWVSTLQFEMYMEENHGGKDSGLESVLYAPSAKLR